MSLQTPQPTRSHYAETYLRMSGNCTRLLSTQMLSLTTQSHPITPTSSILDSACGPGIVTADIKKLRPDAHVLAADLSPAMLEEVQAVGRRESWRNVETRELDVRELEGVGDGVFSHVFANLGLPVPGDEVGGVRALKEAFRVLRVGGVAVFSTWADRVWPAAFAAAAKAVRPDGQFRNPMALPKEQMSASWLLAQFEKGGFGNNVEVRPCVTYTSAESLDGLVKNMMLAKGMFFPEYSEDELQRAEQAFKESLTRLRTFEEVESGGVRVGMKAWIAIGRKMGDEGETIF